MDEIKEEKKVTKPPTPKKKKAKKYKTLKRAGSKRIVISDTVDCYLTPKAIKYCHNFVSNGGNKTKAGRDAGFLPNYVFSKSFTNNPYIPMYIEKLQKDLMEFDQLEGEPAESYADRVRKNGGIFIVKRLLNIMNYSPSRVCRWDNSGVEYFPSEEISPEDMSAIKSITSETTEYMGKNPRKTTKLRLEVCDPMAAMKEFRDLVGIDYKKDSDANAAMDLLKDFLANNKKTGIFPTMPTPETDPSLLLTKEEEETPMSDVVRH
jgi:hypothetical protein